MPEIATKMTDFELKDFSKEHLGYEIWMLLNVSSVKLPINYPADLSQFLSNILLESFAIHLRNLVTFLYPTSLTKPTDIYAKNYFKDPDDWMKICPPISNNLEKARNRAHKEVGHLTTERIKGFVEHKKWEISDLTDEIKKLLILFAENADKKKLDISIVERLK